MNNHKKYERERERMIKKKLHSPEWEERFVCVNEREMIKKKKSYTRQNRSEVVACWVRGRGLEEEWGN